ncbi:TetR/AcrR family transcriptional regulator [Flammeovirgaceae bacterium SG7u.111]|nr:TetR/AcrR family transcriptional regulator [Flammeovirgaceae bacterium SG7u.132]WPO36307.1 TetR/AcrR family transcriptional regulator [Flammeovirgaceae bacterium SG7u.111]
MNTEQNMEQVILEAATKLFLDKGFKATSTTEIAKEAGCNQALVHYYFRTKDRLFEAIFEKKMKYFINSLLQINNEDLPFEEKLKKRIASHFDVVSENPKLPLMLFHEINTNPKRMESIKTALGDMPQLVFQHMQKELDIEIEKGTVRPMNIHDLLMTIVSLNIIVFLAEPIFKTITGISDETFKELQQRRKNENIAIIIRSIKP